MTPELQQLLDLPSPSTKSELLERILPAREELLRTITSLSLEDLSRPGHEGWSTKDHLAHVAAWQRMVVAHLRDGTDHAVLGMGPEVYAAAGLEVLNTRIYELHRNDPASDVLGEFNDACATLKAIASGLSDKQLAAPYWEDDTRPVIDKIASDSYRHDIEHLEWIEELLQRLRATA